MVNLSPFSDGLSALGSHRHIGLLPGHSRKLALCSKCEMNLFKAEGFVFILKTVSPKYNLSIINYTYLNHKA